jgi:hypothetical protein
MQGIVSPMDISRMKLHIAKEYFEQITKSVSAAHSPTIEQDAYLRAADCYFMNKDFKQALKCTKP